MTPDAPTAAPEASQAPANWIDAGEAARRLGVSARAVQKRCASGTFPARRIEGKRGTVWEVNEGELKANTNANFSTNSNTVRSPVRTQKPLSAPIQGERRTNQRELEGERERELKDEVRFLRGVIESDRRDMAELRAALREALKLAPKQLSQGTEETPRTAPQRAPNMEVGSSGGAAPSEAKTGGKPLTLADVADELDRMMGG
jgi:hypothetical protein